MKFILIILSVAIFASSQAKKPTDPPAPAECSFCSVDVDKNLDCVCSSSTRIARKYPCGPACTALGYCCESTQCPICGSGVNPSSDASCTCGEDSMLPRRVKYACGPACDALGYCCDETTFTTSKTKKFKCKAVETDA